MKKIFLIIFIFVNCYLLQASEQSIYSAQSMQKFSNLYGKEKMTFFNALSKNDRMNFMFEFMKDRSFDLPPTEVVKFYSDGEFICDAEAEGSGMVGGDGKLKSYKYLLGKWYFKDGKIFINNLDPNTIVYGKYLILDDVKIDDYYENRKSANFIFHVLKGLDNDGTDLSGKETGLWGGVTDLEAPNGISPAIDSYTKLKQAKKKIEIK
jgi:hypothetical protein